ncbi:hypothetical protein SEUCBS139899_003694 [Sporothrix eucalyptigena]|uniref:mRNA export factor GLE1 n=1 Tax=Sporothrix eucalyptigena TaxID=1812306 RepID=A0ABP0BRG3_9PEZI
MTNSSPPRPPTAKASPAPSWRHTAFPMSDPPEISDFLLESRNSPEAHRRNYAEAQREHDRVLKAALHVFDLHQLAEAQREIEEEEKRRRQRVAEEAKRIEKERQAKIKQLEDEARLAAQKAAPIPKPVVAAPPPEAAPSPPLLPPPPAEEPKKEEAPKAQPAQPPAGQLPASQANSVLKGLTPQLNGSIPSPFGAASLSSAPKVTPLSTQPSPSPFGNGVATAPTKASATATPPVATTSTTVAPPAAHPELDRHIELHKNLKALRKFMVQQAKSNPALKGRMGDMRRDIRKSFGQLTSGGLRENRVPVARIIATLTAGLKEVPSEMMDASQFVLMPRQPMEGALHNEDMLPSLYLYLLNVLSKAAISQFINESGADARTAEAIGQAVVKVYSEVDFLWRGKPMIDMLIAKYRVVCPVLFGVRGNDRMERGRAAVGWRKEDGHWIPEQFHIDRMTGLGAGFAAMTLRDFSRVKRVTPWPPTAYWTALAQIVNTPSEEMSQTQCYVLKAMIADNEARFLGFYGNAGVAALRCALVDFPARIPKTSAASETLKVLAKTINVKTGLDLENI